MDKLLLIDDEDDVRYSFKRIFESPDLDLETAASGEEGLEVIKSFQPDLVLMDVRMGGITGLETLRRIRQDDAKLPVIMMTAFGTTQTAIEAMKLGAYDYLLKPLSANALRDALTQAQAVFMAPRGGEEEGVKHHVSTAVIGTRGGVGASTLVTSLAWIFSTEKRMPTALLDLDVHFGTGDRKSVV